MKIRCCWVRCKCCLLFGSIHNLDSKYLSQALFHFSVQLQLATPGKLKCFTRICCEIYWWHTEVWTIVFTWAYVKWVRGNTWICAVTFNMDKHVMHTDTTFYGPSAGFIDYPSPPHNFIRVYWNKEVATTEKYSLLLCLPNGIVKAMMDGKFSL